MRILLVLISLILLVGVVSADTSLSLNATHDCRVVASGNTTWDVIRNAAGSSTTNNPATETYIQIVASTGSNWYTTDRRVIITINGSSIPDDAIISAANISVYETSKQLGLGSPSMVLVDATPADPMVCVAGDYDGTTYAQMASNNLTSAEWSTTGAWGTFNLNAAGIAKISKTGNFAFMLTSVNDVYNTTPTWASAALWNLNLRTVVQGNYIPKIDIIYTLPDTTPPNSITGLSNNTATCHNINWTWTNPTDADYNGLMVWKNGTFFHNLSSSATSDLWLNLTELTEYTFGSKTFDATNNINATFVNRTSTTSKCPPGPIASFISNVTCGIVPFRVQFNDTTYSTTNLTGWNWSFGDGNYSAVQNPVFEYNLSGMFTVNINATNAWGSNISQIPNYMRAVPNWATCPATPTPTPTWQPEINPSTEVDIQPNGWWLIAGGMILFIWFIFRRTR